MASLQKSTLVPPNEEASSDPFDWNLAQLEYELCDHPHPSWTAVSKRVQLPADLIRRVLRDNFIDGQTLMEAIHTTETITRELGITPFGIKIALLRVVDYFRGNSPHYQLMRQQQTQNNHAELYDRRMSLLNGEFESPRISHSNPSALMRSPVYGLSPPTTRSQHLQSPTYQIVPVPFSTVHDPLPELNRSDATQQTVETIYEDAIERLPEAVQGGYVPQVKTGQSMVEDQGRVASDDVPKTKKRIAPTFVAHLDQDRIKAYKKPPAVPRKQTALPPSQESSLDEEDVTDFTLVFEIVSDSQRNVIARQTRRVLQKNTGQPRSIPGRQGEKFAEFSQSEPDDTLFDVLLRKYPPKNSDEDALAVYGESGDENEYDQETWDEIQADIEETKRDNMLSLSRKFLSAEAINHAINEAIEEMKIVWREKCFPKVEVKGYRLWTKAARDGHRWMEAQSHAAWVNDLRRRIAKLRAEILLVNWNKQTEVKHQCQIIEETIFQCEEHQYYVTILNNTTPPNRPEISAIRQRKTTQKPVLPEGEEVIESDDDTDLMDDFIVDDSSDAASIPHDAPDPEVKKFLKSRKDHGVGNHELSARSSADESTPSISSEHRRMEVEPVTPVKDPGNVGMVDHAQSEDSDDECIVTPASRKSMSNRARRSILPRLLSKPAEGDGSVAVKSEDDGYMQDSDLDLLALPKTKYRSGGKTILEPIDLDSSSADEERTEDENLSESGDFDVRTPDLNPGRDQAYQTPQVKLSLTNTNATALGESSPPQIKISQPMDSSGLPNLEDVESIRSLSWDVVADNNDRRLALAKAVYELSFDTAKPLKKYVERYKVNQEKQLELLRKGMIVLCSEDAAIRAFTSTPQRMAYTLGLLFLSYIHLRDCMDQSSVSPADIQEAYRDLQSGFKTFFITLKIALNAYNKLTATPEGQSSSKKRKRILNDSDQYEDLDDDSGLLIGEILHQSAEPGSAHKKRKYQVKESQEAKSQQLNDQLRVQEQERRRLVVEKRMQAMGAISGEFSRHTVNFDEPLVYLDPHIARRVKPHQVTGIQFMWREIINDSKQRGCLLAHTMGLGKTMQVISLLVTIAQCNQSADPEIRNLIPEKHREMKVLILCPPSLLDNWHEELLMWIPPGANLLGEIRKISTEFKAGARAAQIHAWATTGGILLLGYEMFLRLVERPKSKLSESEAIQLENDLLNGPSIIVADEAHKMKNARAKITQFASKFRSISRIALTGSPLNNHLEEYHTMIEWIAPGYLGDIVQFRANYSEPITEGLYTTSSAYERRRALKKLHVLKRDLDPKICRADISAIEKDMPSKAEFFITIPLTPLQITAYGIYVSHVLGANSVSGASNAQLWDYLAVLSLLCNHPTCFVKKLQDRKDQANKPNPQLKKKKSTASTDEDDVPMPMDVPPSKLTLPTDIVDRAIGVFSELDENGTLDLPELSNRSLIVSKIVKESMAVGDKVLIFSHSIPTLDYLEILLNQLDCKYTRIDGTTNMGDRQDRMVEFNKKHDSFQVFLISMRAGGLGLNLQGANRIILYDFSFNPSWEEQAVGRAYRLGQRKPVFVYRFRAGGTFEEVMHSKALYKTQLFQRVVDKKNPMRHTSKSLSEYLFLPQDVEKKDYSNCIGKDPHVLDVILAHKNPICNIELTETFQKEDDEHLTPEDLKEAEEEYADQKLARDDPVAFRKKQYEKDMKIRVESESLQIRDLNFPQPGQVSVSPYLSTVSALVNRSHHLPRSIAQQDQQTRTQPQFPVLPGDIRQVSSSLCSNGDSLTAYGQSLASTTRTHDTSANGVLVDNYHLDDGLILRSSDYNATAIPSSTNPSATMKNNPAFSRSDSAGGQAGMESQVARTDEPVTVVGPTRV